MTAAVLGAAALMLVSASILLVWANRTLTDTNTYVATVGPVLRTPALQDYVADQITQQVITSVSLPDLANNLLGPSQLAMAPAQQQELVKSVIHDSVINIMNSPQIQAAWTDTNRQAHAALMNELNSNAPKIAIDVTPLETAVLAQLKQSKLAAVTDNFDIGPAHPAVVGVAGGTLERIHEGYNWLRTAPWLVVLATLVCGALSVWISVHHAKTLRRMLIDTGLSSLVVAALVALSGRLKLPAADPAAAKVAAALVGTLLHGLQTALIILGVICLVAAGASKWYSRSHPA